jgi:DNA mismatch repair protein MutS2
MRYCALTRRIILEEIAQKTYRSLEWERLKNFLTAEAESALGQHLCHELHPVSDSEQVKRRLDETEEVMFMLQARSGLSAAGLPWLEEQLSRLEAGASLSGAEFGQIKTMLKIAQAMKTSINLLPRESFPRIVFYYDSIHALPQVKKQIEEVVDDQGNFLDSASDLLYQLRREVSRLQAQISSELQKIIHSSTLSKALQEPIYTQRNGRFVLPVNANQRSVVPGIVHDSSASGLTIYVEPLSVLELSNKKRLKESEIEREIIRILDQLGRALQEHVNELKSNYETIGKLDAISARARLALKYDGKKPELSAQILIDYKQARHPLLVLQTNVASIVANDITIGDNQEHERTLIITGPNTGGKTVLLKTIGIFALMVRSGLLLPVSDHSTTCIFDHVYADIGDEQSLEQSLSTFSSHMQNIVNIVDRASRGTLVLLDEVGAGTDPREGAALAKSLLEFLNSTGAMTIATTHFSELKTMAYSDRAFLNGSLEFNEITLSPSYRLKLGVPGSSKAMAIAHRLGLNDAIVDRANELVLTDDKDFQSTIDQLEKRMLEMENREQRLNEATEAAERERREYEQKKKELTVASEKTRSTLAAQLNDEFQTSKEYVRHLIADLQKEPGIAKAQKVQKELDSLRKELGWLDKANTPANASKPRFTPGQSVKVRSLNQRGILVSITEKKADGSEAIATVKAGSLNLKVPLSDLELSGGGAGSGSGTGSDHETRPGKSRLQKMTADIKRRGGGSASHQQSSNQHSNHSNQIRVFVRTSSNTLDIRGQRVDEGLSNLDQFLNQAMVHETSPLMVIHGHGTGALKSAVRDALASNNALEQYRPGENHEGGDGVTIVEL